MAKKATSGRGKATGTRRSPKPALQAVTESEVEVTEGAEAVGTAGEAERDVPEAPGSVPGHNSGGNELTEAERQALFINGLGAIENLIAEKNSIVGKIRNERARLKAHGFKPFEIDYALRLRKNEDQEELDRRRREAEIAKFLGHPVGTQADLFDEVDRTPAVERAYEQGKIAGMEGRGPLQPPHAVGTEQYQEYCRGWHDGQAELLRANMKTKTDPEEPPFDLEGQDKAGGFDDALPDSQPQEGAPGPDAPVTYVVEEGSNEEVGMGAAPQEGEEITSGVMVPRSEFRQMLAGNHAVAEDLIKKAARAG